MLGIFKTFIGNLFQKIPHACGVELITPVPNQIFVSENTSRRVLNQNFVSVDTTQGALKSAQGSFKLGSDTIKITLVRMSLA